MGVVYGCLIPRVCKKMRGHLKRSVGRVPNEGVADVCDETSFSQRDQSSETHTQDVMSWQPGVVRFSRNKHGNLNKHTNRT